jgi:citrate lyase beta subunit
VQDLERPGPIFSRLVEDPAFGEAIDEFVIGVAERVDHLQDADSKGDIGELRRLAAQLVVDARAAGFDLLADVATSIESACLERSYKPAHDGVVALTELARRVRLGHRGAMS